MKTFTHTYFALKNFWQYFSSRKFLRQAKFWLLSKTAVVQDLSTTMKRRKCALHASHCTDLKWTFTDPSARVEYPFCTTGHIVALFGVSNTPAEHHPLTGLLVMTYIYAIDRQLTHEVAVQRNIAKDTSWVWVRVKDFALVCALGFHYEFGP